MPFPVYKDEYNDNMRVIHDTLKNLQDQIYVISRRLSKMEEDVWDYGRTLERLTRVTGESEL
jgi:hypothetical protein